MDGGAILFYGQVSNMRIDASRFAGNTAAQVISTALARMIRSQNRGGCGGSEGQGMWE